MIFKNIYLDGFKVTLKKDSIELKKRLAINKQNPPKEIEEFFKYVEIEINKGVSQIARGSNYYYLDKFRMFINKDSILLVLLKNSDDEDRSWHYFLNEEDIKNLKYLLNHGEYL